MKQMLVSQAALSKPSIYGQCDYTILEMSALLFFLIVTLLRSVEECLLVVLQPALSLGLSTGLPHDSWRLLEAAKTIPGTVLQCQASDPFTLESFLHILKRRHLAFR